jgi:hypothetical protein
MNTLEDRTEKTVKFIQYACLIDLNTSLFSDLKKYVHHIIPN